MYLRYGLPPLAGGQRDQPLGWFERGERLHRIATGWRVYCDREQTARWIKENPALHEWGQEMEKLIARCRPTNESDS